MKKRNSKKLHTTKSAADLKTQLFYASHKMENERIKKTLDNKYEYSLSKSGKKEYICQSCNCVIKLGESSFVVWLANSVFSSQFELENRRHWHISCFKKHNKKDFFS